MSIQSKILKEIVPFLAYRTKLPATKKISIVLHTLLNIWIIYIGIIFLAKPFYCEHEVHVKNLSFYSCDENHGVKKELLFTAYNHIEGNELFATTPIRFIYLNNTFFYNLANIADFIYGKSYAATLMSNSLLKLLDFEKKVSMRYRDDNESESIEAIMVHEAIHVLQYQRYGFFKVRFKIPQWVIEGYAVYSSLPLSKVYNYHQFKQLPFEKMKYFSMHQKYILWGQMVKHAIKKMHKSVDDLHLGKVDYDEVLDSLLREYNVTGR